MTKVDKKQPIFIQIPLYSFSFSDMQGKIHNYNPANKKQTGFGIFMLCRK